MFIVADTGSWVAVFLLIALFGLPLIIFGIMEFVKMWQPQTRRRELELDLARKKQEIIHLEEKIAELRSRDQAAPGAFQ